MFRLLRQSQCVLSMAQCQCLEQPPASQHSPMALDMLSKASVSFSSANPTQSGDTYPEVSSIKFMNFSVLPYFVLKMHGSIDGLLEGG